MSLYQLKKLVTLFNFKLKKDPKTCCFTNLDKICQKFFANLNKVYI